MGGNHLSAGANWPQRLWQGTASPTGGIVAQDAGPPTMRFNGGSVPYTPIGLEGWPNFGFEKNDRWQFSSDVTWARGRHTIKGGFEFRHHNFPSRGWGVGGDGGQLQLRPPRHGGVRRGRKQPDPDRRSVRVLPAGAGPSVESDHPGVPIPSGRRTPACSSTTSSRSSDKLTLTARPALRLSVGPDRSRRPGTRPSARRRRIPEREACPGAMIFAGDGPGRSGQRKFEDVPKDAWGPRLGFAYRIDDKQAVRGGYGIYYANVAFNQSRSADAGIRVEPRSRRTTPTASSRRITWTRASPRTESSSRRSSIPQSISAGTSSPSRLTV